MKRFNLGALALAGVLAIGGGSVFAASTLEKKEITTKEGIEVTIEDEEVLKAYENGEVEIKLDDLEEGAGKEIMTEDGITVTIEDEEILKAYENGEVEIKLGDLEEGIEVTIEDEEVLKAYENGEVEIKIGDLEESVEQ